MTMNGHFAGSGEDADFEHGVQIIDEDKNFNGNLTKYLSAEGITKAGFNYHLISVFGSQEYGEEYAIELSFWNGVWYHE